MPKTEGTFLPPSPKATGIKTQKKRAQTLTAKPLPKKTFRSENTELCVNPCFNSDEKRAV
jgi:hypothetical protein